MIDSISLDGQLIFCKVDKLLSVRKATYYHLSGRKPIVCEKDYVFYVK